MAAMTAAVVRPATVVAATVSVFAVLVIVVVAFDVGIISEFVLKKSLDCYVARAADTTIELDASFGKSRLCATADASAYQNISIDCL